jgi:hypothetical protein
MDEELLSDVKNRFVLFPVKYDDIWQMYKTAQSVFWVPSEVDLALDDLLELVHNNAEAVRPWEALIKQLLDFLESMPENHVRHVLNSPSHDVIVHFVFD